MKKKYKIYLLLYGWGMSMIDTIIAMAIILKSPDNRITYGTIAAIIHMLIMVIGARYISNLSKRDPVTPVGTKF